MPPKGKFPPWAFFPLFSLVVFFPCLFLGKSYFHDDLLISFNISRQFLRDQIASGHFPLWDPFLMGGQPLLGDPGDMAAYPFLYPTLLFPDGLGLSFFLFLHMTLAALGTRYLLRQFNLSEEACRVGAVTFSLSGFFWWEIIHPNILAAFGWLPWFMALLEKFIQKPDPRTAFGAGITLAFLCLAGHHQISLFAIYGGLLYALLRWGESSPEQRRALKKTGVPSFFYFLWGLVPFLLWLIPAGEFLFQSSRFKAHPEYPSFNADFSLDPRALYQFLFPTNPLGPTLLPYSKYLDNSGYLGLWAIFLIFLALLQWHPRKRIWVILGLGSLALALGSYLPFHRWACDWLPGFALARAPFRYIFFYTLSGSVLAAMGYEGLRKGLGSPRPGYLLPAAAIYAAALLAVLFLETNGQGFQAFFLGMGLMGLYLTVKDKTRAPVYWGVFQLSLLLSLLGNAWNVARAGPASNFDYSAQMPFLAVAQKETAPGRVLIDEHIPYQVRSGSYSYLAKFPVDTACLFGLRTINGYTGLSLSKYRQLEDLPIQTFLKLMAVKGFVVGAGRKFDSRFSRWDYGTAQFYAAPEEAPLVWAPGKLSRVAGEDGVLQAMGGENFDPYQESYYSRPFDPRDEGALGHPPALLGWKESSEGPNEEVFNLRLAHAGPVVFSEVVYPGWTAQIDGHPARLYTADYLLRSLVVPSGEHLIRFCYRPWWLIPLSILGLLWIFSLAVWGFLPRDPKV
jgi:hypothetical protein